MKGQVACQACRHKSKLARIVIDWLYDKFVQNVLIRDNAVSSASVEVA